MALFEIPSVATLLEEILGKIKEKRPGAGTAPGSDADVQGWTLAHVVHGLHLHLKYGLLHNLIPTKSSGWVLSAWAWLFGLSDGSGGYGRIIARGSSVDAGFTFIADAGPGWVDLQDEVFTDSAGQQFKINESYTPVGAGATPALDVIAVTTGESTNIEVWHGESYTWESTPAKMLGTIVQAVDLDGGADKELDGPLRARLAERLQSAPMGGNWSHWREIAQEASAGNIDAWVWEGNHNDPDGYGSTDIACTQRSEDGSAKALKSTNALYDTVDAALVAQVMYGALFRARFLDSSVDLRDVELTLTLNDSATDSQRCDWDAEAVKFTTAAFHVVNKTITCNANCHETISVGDRVMVYSGQAVVTAVGLAGGLGANTMFEVSVWFTTYDAESNPFPWPTAYTPAVTDHVYSGGGIIMDCVRALREKIFRPLGPYRGSAGTSAPQPGWNDVLRLQNIQAAMIAVGDAAGEAVVIDTTIAVPAADETPAAGSDTEVFFLAPDELIVWEAK